MVHRDEVTAPGAHVYSFWLMHVIEYDLAVVGVRKKRLRENVCYFECKLDMLYFNAFLLISLLNSIGSDFDVCAPLFCFTMIGCKFYGCVIVEIEWSGPKITVGYAMYKRVL